MGSEKMRQHTEDVKRLNRRIHGPNPPVDPALEERHSSSPMDVLYTAVFIATAIYGGVQGAPWWIPALAGFCAGTMFAAILFDAGVLGKRDA